MKQGPLGKDHFSDVVEFKRKISKRKTTIITSEKENEFIEIEKLKREYNMTEEEILNIKQWSDFYTRKFKMLKGDKDKKNKELIEFYESKKNKI